MASQTKLKRNPLISRNAHPDEKFVLNVVTFNIANAGHDIRMNPLKGRIGLIVEAIKSIPNVDALIILEAGRDGWTRLAGKIERGTGLTYLGLDFLNPTPMSFAKAIFINRNTCAILQSDQRHTGANDGYPLLSVSWSGDYFGNAVSWFFLQPVVLDEDLNDKGEIVIRHRVIADRCVRVAGVHFPMILESRLQVSTWVNECAPFAHVWMGDWNTFPDMGGPEMIERITAKHRLREVTPPDVPFTFRAFLHDTIPKPASFRSQLNEHSEVVSEGEKDGQPIINVRFASVLDRVFCHQAVECDVKVLPLTDASDHCPVLASIVAIPCEH